MQGKYIIPVTKAPVRNIVTLATIRSLFLFCLFLASLLCNTNSFAQYTYELDKTTRFEMMNAEDGLSSGYVTCIHQDKYGFIWIGSQLGLNLYDGYEVKVFYADPNNPRSLFNSWITGIYEEPNGTMWFCTDKGISKYNRATQSFSNYLPDTIDIHNGSNTIDKILPDGDYLWVDVWKDDLFRFNKHTGEFRSYAKDTVNPSNGIYGNTTDYMFIDGSGDLWVGTSKFGVDEDFAISRFNKESETFVHFINDPADPESFVDRAVMSMIEDHEGTIWVASLGGGLLKIIDKEKGKFRQYVHNENDKYSIIHDYLIKVFEDSKGNIWIGGFNGFSQLNKSTGQFTNYHVFNRADFSNRSDRIRDISEDMNGELCLTSNNGLFRFNPTSKVLTHYHNDPEIQSSISHNWVKQVLIEPTGQTWLVLPNSGMNRINQFSNNFRRIQKKTNVNNSLSGKAVGIFYADSKGYFWVGCRHHGGLNRTEINDLRVYDDFEHFDTNADDPESLSGNDIVTICEDQDQILWFGTFISGLNRYDYNTNSFTRFQNNISDSTTISSNVIMCIFEDSHGTFWVGTRFGLNIMDRETGKFIRILHDENDSSSISNEDIRVIYEDSFGELWFGGEYLDKLNREDTSFVQCFPESGSKNDVYQTQIWGIKEDDSTNLWLSSFRGGLYKLDRNSMTFTSLTIDQGLPSNSIAAIEIDDKGFIWASSNQGLSRIDPNDYSIRNFNVEDGLISLEFINRSSYKDDDGWLYFGSRDGFNVFHPDSIQENKFIPPVYITSIVVAGQHKYFDKPLYEMSTVEFQYNENDFNINFVALNYINSQKNQYAYMLEGYDKDWKYVGNKHVANYTNMSSGEYTFRVKASNNDGYWNEEGASLIIVIQSPIWKTWWAYVIYTIVFIVLVYLVRRNEIRRINLRQALELEQVNAENLAELDAEKNKFFSNISHEFRTPLTLMLGPLERLIGSPKDESQKQQLNMVKRNARRLQALINQLLSLSKIESGKMLLRTRPENIVKLTRLFLQSFSSMAEERGVKLEFESDAEEYMVYIDTLKFEKVINNLLSNAFKFTERGGKVKIGISAEDNPIEGGTGVSISISDTGIGIAKEKLPHVFDRFYQVDETQMKTNLGTGIGLSLTKELIELHHGTISAESEVGMGTNFTIFLPSGKEHLSEEEIFISGNYGSEEDENLLNDDYLFVQNGISKAESITEVPEDNELPFVLIVEDNEDMRTYIKSYLINTYNIIEAADGKEGADKAIEHIPDLIVSDLMMPKLDGNEMTIQLKSDERTSHIPIILLTARASKESKLEGLEIGADDFLTKPFDADELLIRIKNLIAQRRKLSELLSQHLGDNSQTHLIQMSSGNMFTKIDELFIEKATAIIQEHMASPDLNVELLAREMAVSRVQLHRKLKNLTDHSPSDLIRNIRMMKAAELLKEGYLNVTQVSYEIGILSISNFAKTFKDKYGVNPSEYS